MSYSNKHKSQYIIRFDDITPTMDWGKFLPLKKLLEELGIKSILGVVPDNKDPKLNVSIERHDNFFEQVLAWKKYGDTISQHGYTHVYDSTNAGILQINKRSEFAGHSFDQQFQRLKKGKEILERYQVWEPYFMAPAHSFDKNTLKALKALGFLALTDGYGYYPYEIEGIIFVPQLATYPVDFGFGIHTLCIHINSMTSDQIDALKIYIRTHKDKFVDFKSISSTVIKKEIKINFLIYLTSAALRLKRVLRRF